MRDGSQMQAHGWAAHLVEIVPPIPASKRHAEFGGTPLGSAVRDVVRSVRQLVHVCVCVSVCLSVIVCVRKSECVYMYAWWWW